MPDVSSTAPAQVRTWIALDAVASMRAYWSTHIRSADGAGPDGR